MNTSPPPPESKLEQQGAIATPAAEQRDQRASSSEEVTPQQLAGPSWGERLLPLLFVAMETCWIDAILIGLLSINLLGLSDTLVPLGTPFVLLAGFYFISRYLDAHLPKNTSAPDEARKSLPLTPAKLTVFTLISLATLFVIWSSVYAAQIFALDPGWLLGLPQTILQFNSVSFHIIVVILLSVNLCRRGSYLARNVINPPQVLKTLRFGACVIVLLIVIQGIAQITGMVFTDWSEILLLVALFFFLSLTTNALAQIAFVRRYHPIGLAGSIARQERMVVQIIGTLSLVFLSIALLASSIFDPTLLMNIGNTLGPPFNWILRTLVYGVTLLLTPLVWLLGALPNSGVSNNAPTGLCSTKQHCSRPLPKAKPISHAPPHHVVQAHATGALPDLSIVLIVLLVLTAIVLIILAAWTLRRWRKGRNSQRGDLHESLWSWPLFSAQFKHLLLSFLAFFTRFFPRRDFEKEDQAFLEETQHTPNLRSMREIYRALLKSAAGHGHPRTQDETPYEFRQRLARQLPFVEPQLTLITEAYAAARYGGVTPGETEVTHLQRVWMELEEKWQKIST